jgi:hypothetical protein
MGIIYFIITSIMSYGEQYPYHRFPAHSKAMRILGMQGRNPSAGPWKEVVFIPVTDDVDQEVEIDMALQVDDQDTTVAIDQPESL